MPHGGDHDSPGEPLWYPAPASSHLLAACDDSGETLRVGRLYISVGLFGLHSFYIFQEKLSVLD